MAADGSGTTVRIILGRIARQLAALIAVALALLVRVVLERHSITLPIYITFYPVVLLAALLGGIWVGILATALSALVVDYFFLVPVGSFYIRSTSDLVGMTIFCFSGVLVSVVAELYHRNREKLIAYKIEGAVQDERRKAEEERKLTESIRAERQRFLDVLETLPTMISLLTPDHRIAFANRSYREKFGACRDERCFETRFGRSAPCEFCESYAVLETGKPHHWEMTLRDGSLMDAYDYPFADLDGSSLILEMKFDITERKSAEAEIKKHRDALEELVAERTQQLRIANLQLETDISDRKRVEQILETTLRRFYLILANLSAGVLLVTDDGRIEFANQAFCSQFGLKESPADLVASFDSEKVLAKIDAAYENPDRAIRRIREILAKGQTVLGEEVIMQDAGVFLRDFVPMTVAGKSYGRMWVHTDISDLKQKEDALSESRAKLSAALTSMTDSAIITDAEGRFVEFNDAFATFYRFKSKAECAKDFDEFKNIFEVSLAGGESAPEEMYAVRRALRGETATAVEYTIRRKDTGESWIGSISFGPIRDADGAIMGSVITARDITEAKRGETRLRRFYETDLFAILYWKIDGGVVDANNKFLEMTGYSRDELRAGQLNWSEITPPEYWALDEDARRQVRETGVHLPYEKEFIRKDGTRVWGLFSAAAYEDDRTQGVSFILDITKRKITESALKESEKQYRNLFNAMNEGFCVIEVLFDANGKPEDYRFLEVNDAFENQTGLHDAVGKRMRELAPAHEEHWFEIYGRIALTGEPSHFLNEAKALNRVYDVHAYRVGEPEQRRVAIVFNDFSDYKRAEDQLKKLNRTLLALSASNQAILHATDEPAFLAEVCRVITRDCGHAMVWIGIAENDDRQTVRPVAYSGFEEGYMETLGITWDETERGRGPTGSAIRTGQLAMCRNMLVDPAFAPWRADAIKRGYASLLVLPLKDQERAWGAITIYSREPDGFSEGEVELLTELAGDLEFGIQTLRLRAARERAEKALRESEELLGLFVEHAPAALAMFDREMRYLHASRRWRQDYGLGDGDLRGVSHYVVFPEIPERWKEAHSRGLAGELLSVDDDRFERADGSVQWVRWEIRPWSRADGEVGGIVIFSEDTTKRREAEAALLRNEKLALQRQQLQALAKRLHQAREEERKMVARDLHDQIGQILTAIKMDLSWVVRHLPDLEDPAYNRLKGSIELINEGVRSVRKICSGLRPGILDDLGLAAAIEWQANEFAARTGIRCEISIPPAELHLDSDRATAIFRIFQECLTNIARHAEAKSVSASLSVQGEDLLLTVNDNGKGFREIEVAGSLGVLGMRERASACGGDVQISSSPGEGTTVTVCVPLHDAGADRGEHAHSDS